MASSPYGQIPRVSDHSCLYHAFCTIHTIRRDGTNHAIRHNAVEGGRLEQNKLDFAVSDSLQHLRRPDHRFEHFVTGFWDVEEITFLRIPIGHVQDDVS